MREESKVVEAKCKEAKQENAQLKQKLEKLRVEYTAQRNEYQKQVDEMFLYGYRCCIKKNDITQDTPSFPSNDEGETPGGSFLGNGIFL